MVQAEVKGVGQVGRTTRTRYLGNLLLAS